MKQDIYLELQKAMRADWMFGERPTNGWYSGSGSLGLESWHKRLWWFYNNGVRVAGMVNIKLKQC